MRRITLDANVLAPAFTGKNSAPVRLIGLWRAGLFELVLSDHLLQEFARTLSDPYYVRRFSPIEGALTLALLSARAHITGLTVPVNSVATHPEDDLVLSTALSGNASILCTRDKQLLRLRQHQTVSILSPGELLALLEQEVLS